MSRGRYIGFGYGWRSAPSYFDHNRGPVKPPPADVVAADFEPPRFEVREGMIIETATPVTAVAPARE